MGTTWAVHIYKLQAGVVCCLSPESFEIVQISVVGNIAKTLPFILSKSCPTVPR